MICAADAKRKHADTVVLNCAAHDPVWAHRRCTGTYTHPCGCTVLCSCPGHRDNHALLADLEGHVVPNYLDAPFDPSPDAPTIPTLVSIPAGESVIVAPGSFTVDDVGVWSAVSPEHQLAHLTLEQAAELYAEAGARLLAAYDDDPGPDGFAILRTVRRGISRGRDVDALLCKWAIDTQPYGEQTVEGVGAVRVRRTQAAVKWDERGTAYAYLAAKLQAVEGEYPDPETVIDWLLEAAAVSYYRKTALTAAGLDPEEFYTSQRGNPAVDLPKDT